MTLNGYFTLNSILRRYVYSSEAWLLKLGYSCECRRIFNSNEQLRHRAVSLRQHGFRVNSADNAAVGYNSALLFRATQRSRPVVELTRSARRHCR